VSRTQAADLWCCTEDGSRPPEAGLQGQASNHPVLLRSKDVVVSDRGKVTRWGWQVRIEKMSDSKPTEDASLCQGAVETEVDHWLQDESGRYLLTDPMAAGV
jgi:hypothetical protein